MSRDTGISKLPLERSQCPLQEVSVLIVGSINTHHRKYQYPLQEVLVSTAGGISTH